MLNDGEKPDISKGERFMAAFRSNIDQPSSSQKRKLQGLFSVSASDMKAFVQRRLDSFGKMTKPLVSDIVWLF